MTKREIAEEMDRIAKPYGTYENSPRDVQRRWDELNEMYDKARR